MSKINGSEVVQTKQAIAAAIAICATGVETRAAAQDFNPRTAIENRARPEYASPPITVGAFEVVPRIEAGAEYVNNIFASEQFDVDDVILSVRSNISVADRRTDREIRLNLLTGYRTFLDNNASDQVQVNARLSGRFGLGTETRPYLGATFRMNDFSSTGATPGSNPAQPVENTEYGGNIGVARDFGNITLEAEGRVNRYEFNGRIFFDDQILDAAGRDYSYYEGRARASYSSRPDQRFYAEARYGQYDVDSSTSAAPLNLENFFLSDRSGKSYTLVGGVQFQITDVLSFDSNVGYTQLEFDDPRQPKSSGLSVAANVYYSPTRLTRFQLQAVRSVDDTINPLFVTSFRTGFSLLGEHELRRNLVLRGEAEYTRFNAGGFDNVGEEFRTSIGAVFYLSPRISFNVRGEIFDRSGIAAGQQKRALLSLGYNF